MESILLEVVAHVLRTVSPAIIKINAPNVYLHMASTTIPVSVTHALQNVRFAFIIIIVPTVHLNMASIVPEVVAHALQTV
jgi:hypothetical protein